MSDDKKIIECDMCGVGSDCAYVNPKTLMCNACQSNEDYYGEEMKNEKLREEH